VLEKSGFTLEGVIRAAVFKDGRMLDQYLYAKPNKNALLHDRPMPSAFPE